MLVETSACAEGAPALIAREATVFQESLEINKCFLAAEGFCIFFPFVKKFFLQKGHLTITAAI